MYSENHRRQNSDEITMQENHRHQNSDEITMQENHRHQSSDAITMQQGKYCSCLAPCDVVKENHLDVLGRLHGQSGRIVPRRGNPGVNVEHFTVPFVLKEQTHAVVGDHRVVGRRVGTGHLRLQL